jgi:alcohol dehydrogenase
MTFLHEIFESVSLLSVDYIVAVGGGSVLDTAKAIKMLFSVKDWPDFQSQAEKGVNCEANGCLIVAIPTTAGSGSEVTPFATLWDRKAPKKLSIDAPWLLPSVPIVDPQLLRTLSGDRLLYPALDAVSHAVESLWSKRKTPESRDYALRALASSKVAIQSWTSGTYDLTQFAVASTYAGRAIAISRTALAHSISYPLTLVYGVPHGLACSFTLKAITDAAVGTAPLSSEEIVAINSIVNSIQSLDLAARLRTYCTAAEVEELIPSMINTRRSNNTSFALTKNALREIVCQSMLT